MKIKKIKRIGIGFLSVVLLAGFSSAAENNGSAMPSTMEGGTARAMSMGSAVVALPQSSASLFWNPAGLGLMNEGMELGLHHNSGLGESIQETLVFAMPMGDLGGFAAALNYMDNGVFEGRDSLGNLTSNYSANTMGVNLGWGKQWFPNVSAGASVKFNLQTLASTSFSAVAMDFGFLWSPIANLNLGLTYSNLGTSVANISLNSGLRVGAVYHIDKDLLVAASSELKLGGFDRMQLGAEYFIVPEAALRTGYVHNFASTGLEGLTGLTAGLGVKIDKSLMFDYAYVPYGDLGTSHRISLTYKFAGEIQPAPRAKMKLRVPVVEPVHVLKTVPVLEKLIVLDDAHFEWEKDTLTEDGAKVVAENAKILRENPAVKIRIAGYSSAEGTPEFNQTLSEKRAKIVKEILVKEGGIAPDRLATIGYGETRPAVFEPLPEHVDSAEAKANMRVLFEIMVK